MTASSFIGLAREKVSAAADLRRPDALFAPRGVLTIRAQATGTKSGIRAFWMPGTESQR
jgi:hypothetical protein